ncbi:GGDEF domain-containing protein [Paenibacillus hexagrammi]|uniref:GGDEF domain-containing protein n=1 Tax=Paenibacillus hexagrammi TaxID=2908839 RepID=A0ABY3SI90_9BACL|nr:GGDEF domain-containing protein [Paenibacillus sp. YPD9-1]UJF32845.1 GGDEF domain-containing protein [Paenibacillus sp. YPD9-1]
MAILLTKYPLHLLYGIESYFLGSIAWFTVRRGGYGQAVAISLIGSAAGVWLWDQTPLVLVIPLEIALVGLVFKKRRRQLVLLDLVYCCSIGAAAHLAGYYGLSQFGFGYSLIYVMFQGVTSILNAVLGDMAAEYLPRWSGSALHPQAFIKERLKIGRVMTHMSISILVLPLFIFLYLNSQFTNEQNMKNTSDKFDSIASHVSERINQMSRLELRDLKLHSMLQRASMKETFYNVTSASDIKLILVDEHNQVFASNDPKIEDGQEDFDWQPGGIVSSVDDRLYLFQPEHTPLYNPIALWSQSEYVKEYQLVRIPYKLIIKQPIEEYQQEVFQMYTYSLALICILFAIVVLIASRVTRMLERPLFELGSISTGLPFKIRMNERVTWRESRIHEVNLLKNNFEHMSQELASMFAETDQKNLMLRDSEEALRKLAHYDTLTGLANRYSFSLFFPELIHEAKLKGERVLCLFIDLDRFKLINDTYGHDAGDTVLRTLGERLNPYNNEQTRVFRLAGDEFVIITREPLPIDAEGWANQVRLAVVKEPVQHAEKAISLQLSAGLSVFPEHGTDLECLLRNADSAMYAAKVSGRNQIRTYSKPMS